MEKCTISIYACFSFLDLTDFLDVRSKERIQHHRDSINDDINILSKQDVVFHKSCTRSISRSEPSSGKLFPDDAICKVENSSDIIKRRPSKSQGAKSFFFSFLRKVSILYYLLLTLLLFP